MPASTEACTRTCGNPVGIGSEPSLAANNLNGSFAPYFGRKAGRSTT